jgi:hypothetical protein
LVKIHAWVAKLRKTYPKMPESLADAVSEYRPAGRLRRTRTAQILEAAEKTFAAKGFEGATTAEIATLAQLPKANLHYYFGTKENIYLAVLDNILRLWLAEADHWITLHRRPYDALDGYIRAKLAGSMPVNSCAAPRISVITCTSPCATVSPPSPPSSSTGSPTASFAPLPRRICFSAFGQ